MPANFIIVTVAVSLVALTAILLFLVQGPPFVPTSDQDVLDMIEASKIKKKQRLVDLGAGDGKLVIEFAKRGYHIDGVEINPRLIRRANKRIAQNGLAGKASVTQNNFWKFDVSGYDAVLLFAIPHVMGRLEKKLWTELKPGSIIISNYFVFPNLKFSRKIGNILVYEIKN